jgi:purine-binding chemotaxis protein CheW
MNDPLRLSNRAAELRLAFDQSFAARPSLDTAPPASFLGIRLAGQPYAIRLSDIAGLFADKAITRIPGPEPALLGLAGFRSAIVPVYGLHAYLGHKATTTCRWLAIASGAPIALAFDGFDGHLRLSRDAILPTADDRPGRRFVLEFAQAGEVVRPIVNLPSVLEAIKNRPRDVGATKEG